MAGYEFDWGVLWRSPYRDWLLDGIQLTLLIGGFAWIIALVVGILVGTFRVLPARSVRVAGTAYVELFRNVPLLVQLFLWFYAVPSLFSTAVMRMPYLNLYAAIIGLGLYTASRVAEHVRSGLNAISQGQYFAGLSTGLTNVQLYRYVILPHVLRLMIPPITTEFLTIFKNSSLASTIGILGITGAANQISSYTFHGFETITGAIALYLTLGLIVVSVMGLIENKTRIPGLYGRE